MSKRTSASWCKTHDLKWNSKRFKNGKELEEYHRNKAAGSTKGKSVKLHDFVAAQTRRDKPGRHRAEATNAVYEATWPDGFHHAHDLLPPLTAMQVEAQKETRCIHALMMAQPHPPPVEEQDANAQALVVNNPQALIAFYCGSKLCKSTHIISSTTLNNASVHHFGDSVVCGSGPLLDYSTSYNKI